MRAILLGIVLISGLPAPQPALSAQQGKSAKAGPWLDRAALARKLREEVSVSWTGTSYRQAWRNFSSTHRLAFLGDRRLDPERTLELVLPQTPLEQALTTMGTASQAEVALLGSAVYLGPPNAARRLRTVVALREADAKALPAAQRTTWSRTKAWGWPDFAEPRKLLAELAQESGWKIENPQALPHDLWAEAELPPLSLAARLSLVLIQFDRTFEIRPSERTLRIVPLPARVWLEKTYPAGPDQAAQLARFRELAPDAEITPVAKRLRVRGRLEDHERLAGKPVPPIRPGAADALERVRIAKLTLRDATVSKILAQLTRQLGLTFQVDAAALQALETPVTVDVRDATIDQVLKAVLSQVKLAFKRTGSAVRVIPAAKDGNR